MLTHLAQFTVRRRKAVLFASALFMVFAGALGGNVEKHLSTGGFNDPSSESARALSELQHSFGPGAAEPNVVLLVTAKHGTVDDAAISARGAALTRALGREHGVTAAQSYWSLGRVAPLRSRNARQAMVLGVVRGNDDAVNIAVASISKQFNGSDGPVSVVVGGRSEVLRQVSTQIKKDLTSSEIIALPIILLLLVLVFGSFVAAGLPLAVGGLAILGTIVALRLTSSVTDVSIFALNLATALGLGLAIDYSLFIVSRFREELALGREPHDAVVRTVETAGKTVVFSALTLAVALAALVVFPLPFLQSFAYGGIAVALVSAAGSIIFLPALLAVLGPNVNRLSLWHRKPKPIGEGAWHRVAMFVMRRPAVIAVAVVALLVFLGAPFLRVAFGLPDDRVLPAGTSSRYASEQVRKNFTSNEANALSVVATGIGDAGARTGEIGAYAISLSRLPGVSRVDSRAGMYTSGVKIVPAGRLTARFVASHDTWLSVVPNETLEPTSPAAVQFVHDVRNAPAPFPIKVSGNSAFLVDDQRALFGRMPFALLLIALATFVLLFMMFGSVLVPVKALVINVLSLSATFGAMVWIFQEGHLSGLLGFTASGTLDTTTPILMFCVAFGLSMDYEVFLLSRIKEEHDRTGDNESSVAIGLERTGRIVTAAAVLISVVMLSFATSSITFVKQFGLGLALAVLMDAFIIRGTLVPAFMRLAGEANWWAPPALRRIYERWGMVGEIEPDLDVDLAGRAPRPTRRTSRAPRRPDKRSRQPVGTS